MRTRGNDGTASRLVMAAQPDPLPPWSRVLVAIDLPEPGSKHWAALESGELALDGPTQRAINLGLSLAQGRSVRLLHAPSSIADAIAFAGTEGFVAPVEPLDVMDARMTRRAEALLRTLADRYHPGESLDARAVCGRPRDVIEHEAKEWHANVIVLCTSGHGRVSRFFLGSTADAVIRRAPCPVLVIPAEVGP